MLSIETRLQDHMGHSGGTCLIALLSNAEGLTQESKTHDREREREREVADFFHSLMSYLDLIQHKTST